MLLSKISLSVFNAGVHSMEVCWDTLLFSMVELEVATSSLLITSDENEKQLWTVWYKLDDDDEEEDDFGERRLSKDFALVLAADFWSVLNSGEQ